jgi:hypothetical protein
MRKSTELQGEGGSRAWIESNVETVERLVQKWLQSELPDALEETTQGIRTFRSSSFCIHRGKGGRNWAYEEGGDAGGVCDQRPK